MRCIAGCRGLFHGDKRSNRERFLRRRRAGRLPGFRHVACFGTIAARVPVWGVLEGGVANPMRERLSRAVRRASGGTVSHRLCLAALCLFAATISARATGLIFPVPIEATQAAPATKPSPPQAATPQAAPGDYAGTDTCVVCHTDQEKSLQGTQHAQAKNPRTPMAGHGCESCHGPGKAHAEDDAGLKIAKIKEMSPAAQSQTCLTCHNRGNHAGWEGSGHERRNLSCTTCHSVHSPKSF